MPLTPEEMAALQVDDVLIYNDGRAGHCEVKAIVLLNDGAKIFAQFEDRNAATIIPYSAKQWTDYLRRA